MAHHNRLGQEKSPYLLQHASNPVDWFPWGEEAFALARERDVPVFLSIGYSTCHWCHVMERESFEDADVAALMNEAFVSIKVDREERPDIDSLYMKVCQVMTGSGGWPLNILLAPDRRPFFAGTYFPKWSRLGRLGMMELVPRIRTVWNEHRADVLSSADHVTQVLQDLARMPGNGPPGPEALQSAYASLRSTYDARFGGFGTAPKFPSPHTLMFVLRMWRRTGDEDAVQMVISTLRAMRRGGLFDQLGYGFHRYSTDTQWLVPHFEKMLYDQALLAMSYLEAYQVTGEQDLAQTAREILEYVVRDLSDPAGGFYSAEDADSEGEEGKFYVWTDEELRHHLSPAGYEAIRSVFNTEPGGNYVDEVAGVRSGASILHLSGEAWLPGGATAPPLPALETATAELLAARNLRVRPLRDDKILTDWNGLMIAAFAKAHAATGQHEYAEAGRRAARFVLDILRDGQGGLLHRYRDGEAGIRATADDYAFLAWGMLELYGSTLEVEWLGTAIEFMETLEEGFSDTEGGGYFLAAADAEPLLLRPKDTHDGALPSANSVAYQLLLRLFHLTGNPVYADRATRLVRGLSSHLRGVSALGHTHLLSGLDFALGPVRELVVAGDLGSTDTEALLQVARRGFHPRLVWLHRPPGQAAEEIVRLAPFIRDMVCVEGRATAYLCHDFACGLPITSAEELQARLSTNRAADQAG